MEERMQLLDDLDSRRTGILSYRALRLDVPRQALQELTWGMEMNPHARFLGWYRAGDPELERSPTAGVAFQAKAAPDAWTVRRGQTAQVGRVGADGTDSNGRPRQPG